MASTSSMKAELRLVSLRSIPTIAPTNKEEKQQLADDLTKMGCEGLLVEPWTLKSEALVREFLHPRSNEWEATTR